MKAKQMIGLPKAINNSGGSKFKLVYVGNVLGNKHSGWPWAGISLRLKDIFKRIPRNKKQRTKIKQNELNWKIAQRNSKAPRVIPGQNSNLAYTLLRAGIENGDAFLVYHSGEAVVIRKQYKGGGYYLADATEKEIELVAIGVRQIRRNLRWSYGSFCYGVPSQIPLEVDPEKKILV